MTKEFRVKVSVRNNLILKAIEERGYASVAEFSRYAEIDSNTLNSVICFRLSPINAKGQLKPFAQTLAETLGVEPYELWTDEQLHLVMDRNSVEREASAVELAALTRQRSDGILGVSNPEEIAEQRDNNKSIAAVIDSLTEREAKVLRLRFGFDGVEPLTLAEVAAVDGVSRERIRQIEAKAFRKLRNPYRASKIPGHEDAAKHLLNEETA